MVELDTNCQWPQVSPVEINQKNDMQMATDEAKDRVIDAAMQASKSTGAGVVYYRGSPNI